MNSEIDLDTRRKRVLFDFLSRRGAGEAVSIEFFEANHPDLMPELHDMLEGGLKKLRQAIAAEHPNQSLVRGYSFRREINGGGQGTVYEAVQESTGQTVAVKVFRPTSRNAVARFEREVAALAGLSHPGIVRIFDCGRTSDGNYFLAMEYVAGSDLDEWIENHRLRAGNQQNMIDCFVEIADAIGAAHAAGVIHRDLKPSNIRIDPFGHPKVIDFGLASLTNDLSAREVTITGNVVGSIRWTSPEQASGSSKAATAASDVYSLGVLLYEAFSGHPPYDVSGPLHTITRSICTANPKRLDCSSNGQAARLTPALADVVETCLAKRPELRYQAGVEVAAALRAAKSVVKNPRKRSRHKLAVILGCLLIATVLVATRLAIRPKREAAETQQRVELPVFTNSSGMRFRQIPSRPFVVGSPPNEVGRSADEVEHTASVPRGFWLAETEVTQEQYRQIMQPDSAALPTKQASLPSSGMNWFEASRFCEIISERENRTYRLPSEDEWEICCRAASRTPFSIPHAESSIWMKQTSGQVVQPVATLPANDWGLFDMNGNVAEWTSTLSQEKQRSDGQYDALPTLRIIRGGSAISEVSDCRSSARSGEDPKDSNLLTGFRPVVILAN